MAFGNEEVAETPQDPLREDHRTVHIVLEEDDVVEFRDVAGVADEKIIGTCELMCPNDDLEFNRARSILFASTDVTPEEYDHSKLIKSFSRSEAGKEKDPAHVRTPKCLYRTVIYLLDNVLSQEGESKMWQTAPPRVISFTDIFNYVRDRFRGVRNDFGVQHHYSLWTIRSLEYTARFHIMAGHLLCGHSHERGFDPKGNRDMLDDALIDRLWKCYSIFREKYRDPATGVPIEGVPALKHIGEFAAYRLLYKELRQHDDHKKWRESCRENAPLLADPPGTVLRSTDAELAAMSDMPEVLNHPLFVFAMKVLGMYASSNWIGFFGLVKKATYLQACLMANVFPFVRAAFLAQLYKARPPGRWFLDPEWLRELLFFDDDATLQVFLQSIGMVPDATTGKLGRPNFDSAEAHRLRSPSMKIEALRNHRSHKSVCIGNGEVWPAPDVLRRAALESELQSSIRIPELHDFVAPMVPIPADDFSLRAKSEVEELALAAAQRLDEERKSAAAPLPPTPGTGESLMQEELHLPQQPTQPSDGGGFFTTPAKTTQGGGAAQPAGGGGGPSWLAPNPEKTDGLTTKEPVVAKTPGWLDPPPAARSLEKGGNVFGGDVSGGSGAAFFGDKTPKKSGGGGWGASGETGKNVFGDPTTQPPAGGKAGGLAAADAAGEEEEEDEDESTAGGACLLSGADLGGSWGAPPKPPPKIPKGGGASGVKRTGMFDTFFKNPEEILGAAKGLPSEQPTAPTTSSAAPPLGQPPSDTGGSATGGEADALVDTPLLPNDDDTQDETDTPIPPPELRSPEAAPTPKKSTPVLSPPVTAPPVSAPLGGFGTKPVVSEQDEEAMGEAEEEVAPPSPPKVPATPRLSPGEAERFGTEEGAPRLRMEAERDVFIRAAGVECAEGRRRIEELVSFHAHNGLRKLLARSAVGWAENPEAFRECIEETEKQRLVTPEAPPAPRGTTPLLPEGLKRIRSIGDCAGLIVASLQAHAGSGGAGISHRIALVCEGGSVTEAFAGDDVWHQLGGATAAARTSREFRLTADPKAAVSSLHLWRVRGLEEHRPESFADILAFAYSGRGERDVACSVAQHVGQAVATQSLYGVQCTTGVVVYALPEARTLCHDTLQRELDAALHNAGLAHIVATAITPASGLTRQAIANGFCQASVPLDAKFLHARVPLRSLLFDASHCLSSFPSIALSPIASVCAVEATGSEEELFATHLREVVNTVLDALCEALDDAGAVRVLSLPGDVRACIADIWADSSRPPQLHPAAPQGSLVSSLIHAKLKLAPGTAPPPPAAVDTPTREAGLQAAQHAFASVMGGTDTICHAAMRPVRAGVAQLEASPAGAAASQLHPTPPALTLACCSAVLTSLDCHGAAIGCPLFALPMLRCTIARQIHDALADIILRCNRNPGAHPRLNLGVFSTTAAEAAAFIEAPLRADPQPEADITPPEDTPLSLALPGPVVSKKRSRAASGASEGLPPAVAQRIAGEVKAAAAARTARRVSGAKRALGGGGDDPFWEPTDEDIDVLVARATGKRGRLAELPSPPCPEGGAPEAPVAPPEEGGSGGGGGGVSVAGGGVASASSFAAAESRLLAYMRSRREGVCRRHALQATTC